MLEAEMQQVRVDLSEIKADVRKILQTFNEMSGGKKAVLALFAIIGAVGGAIVGVIGMLIGKHP